MSSVFTNSNFPNLIDNLFNALNINFNDFSDTIPSEPHFNRFQKLFSDIIIHASDHYHFSNILIDGLNIQQRNFFYKNISELGLTFTKILYNMDNYNTLTKIIMVHIPRDMKIHNYVKTRIHHSSEFNILVTYVQNVINSLDITDQDRLIMEQNSDTIPVNIKEYLTYTAIAFYCYRNIINSANTRTISSPPHTIPITYPPHTTPISSPQPAIRRSSPLPSTTQPLQPIHIISNFNFNSRIRHQLSDLIFDIKDKMTDYEFINIMQKIAEFRIY